jgi:hypothetical protein
LDQVQGKNGVWAQFFTLPARCLIECPQEKYFGNLKLFLVGCNQILNGAFWWWWWSKWN